MEHGSIILLRLSGVVVTQKCIDKQNLHRSDVSGLHGRWLEAARAGRRMLWTALGAAAACEPAAAAAATRTTPMAPRARAWTSGKAAAEHEKLIIAGSPHDRLWSLELSWSLLMLLIGLEGLQQCPGDGGSY